MDRYNNDGIRGQIEYVDAPADMPTMLAHVDQNIGRILRDSKEQQFLLIKFMKSQREGLLLPERNDWFTVYDRSTTNNTNSWHIHAGVVIFSPEQEEATVPTGITTQRNYDHTKRLLGYREIGADKPQELMELNERLPAFWTDEVSSSGHVLIIPTGELHAKKTVPENHAAAPGMLHRLWLNNI